MANIATPQKKTLILSGGLVARVVSSSVSIPPTKQDKQGKPFSNRYVVSGEQGLSPSKGELENTKRENHRDTFGDSILRSSQRSDVMKTSRRKYTTMVTLCAMAVVLVVLVGCKHEPENAREELQVEKDIRALAEQAAGTESRQSWKTDES